MVLVRPFEDDERRCPRRGYETRAARRAVVQRKSRGAVARAARRGRPPSAATRHSAESAPGFAAGLGNVEGRAGTAPRAPDAPARALDDGARRRGIADARDEAAVHENVSRSRPLRRRSRGTRPSAHVVRLPIVVAALAFGVTMPRAACAACCLSRGTLAIMRVCATGAIALTVMPYLPIACDHARHAGDRVLRRTVVRGPGCRTGPTSR